MLRVLVADDSAVTRQYLAHLLGQDPALKVVGMARDGVEACEQAETLRPDVIIMDVHMPRRDGYEATRHIMERAPTPIVMVSASVDPAEVTTTFQAIQAGALAILEKPRGPDHAEEARDTRRLIETVKLMAEVRVVRRWPRNPRTAKPKTLPAPRAGETRIIAIGASTGGPQVLVDILGRLPGSLTVPIVIVQHMTPGFSVGLAEWLDRESKLTVKLAQAGELALPGTAYIAPDGAQLGITPIGRFHLTAENSHGDICPSASFLFDSVAEAYGPAAVGILLTGMGHDGASGLKHLRERGGVTIAQDEETSAIFGMPAAAIKLGAAQHVLAPSEIAQMICALAGAVGR